MRCNAPIRARRRPSARLRPRARRLPASLRARAFACAIAIALSTALAGGLAEAAPGPRWDSPLESDSNRLDSNNGAALLRWTQPDLDRDSAPDLGADLGADFEFELQEGPTPAFEAPVTRYRGTFPSWYVSGRRDGELYFRVRSRPWSREHGPRGEWSEWSTVATISVQHHDLRFALALMGLGALVFCATALTLRASARLSSETGR